MTLATGTKLGSYEIRSQLGEGGMGEVYRARDNQLSRDVAIKVLPDAFSADSERLRRFEQEAQAAGALNHPNILVTFTSAHMKARPTLFQNYWKAKRCAIALQVRRCRNEKQSIMDYRSRMDWRRRTLKESSTGISSRRTFSSLMTDVLNAVPASGG